MCIRDSVCIDVKPHGTGESEQMIEQLMIMANRAAAMLAEKHHLPFVYRVCLLYTSCWQPAAA